MDEKLARLNRIYPNSGYVLIPKYDASKWEGKRYDSHEDNKAALNYWRNNPLTYSEAQQKAEEGYRIGWVVPKGVVAIDIDNEDCKLSQQYVSKILDKFEVNYSYNYTSRGMHYIFTDPSEKIKSISEFKCGINIQIDTRANGTGYIILPINDPHRAWGEWNDVAEDIPYFLRPLQKHPTPTFIGMQNGDGRNDALFKWRSVLERTKLLNDKDIEKCIRIINENLFDTPMTNKELFQTALRKRDSKEDKDVTIKENIYNNLADELIAKFDIISYFGNFYMFDGIYYKSITEIELEKLIHYDLSQTLSSAARQEIIKFLRVKTQVQPDQFDKDWYKIACKNGIINLVTGELEQANKSEINTICLPTEYNPDPSYSPRIDQFMKELTNGDVLKTEFLYQIAGYCLLKKNLFQKFFLMQGEGGTGKSTFTNLIKRMVGKNNTSTIGLAEFDKDYYLATLLSKLVNIDDDVVDGKCLENTGRFKSIISGDTISVRQIYKPVIDFDPYCTVIFNCNKLPRIMDRTTGLYRRLILIQLNNKIEKPDPLFMNKITDLDMQYFLFRAVEGIKVAIAEGHFRIDYSEEQLLQVFKRRQSPINEWLYETELTLGQIINQKVMILYKQFIEWCGNNGYNKTMSSFSFKEDMCAIYDCEVDISNDEKSIAKVFVKRGSYDEHFRPF